MDDLHGKVTIALNPIKNGDKFDHEIKKEFVDMWDLISFLEEHKDKLSKGRFLITPKLDVGTYQKNLQIKLPIQGLYEIHPEDNRYDKDKLVCEIPFVANIESTEKFSFESLAKLDKSARLVDIQTLIPIYDKKAKKTKLTPSGNFMKLDFTNEVFDGEDEKAIELTRKKVDLYRILLTTYIDEKGKRVKMKEGSAYQAIGMFKYFSSTFTPTLSEDDKQLIELGLANEKDLIKQYRQTMKGEKATYYAFQYPKAGASFSEIEFKPEFIYVEENDETSVSVPVETQTEEELEAMIAGLGIEDPEIEGVGKGEFFKVGVGSDEEDNSWMK